MTENRRDVRYAARIVARVVRRGETLELLTNDVSFRGAFIRTDVAFSLRQLIQVSFSLPSYTEVTVHAMVVHVVAPGNASGSVPGIGVQFFGHFAEAKAWDAFVLELRRQERAGLAHARFTDKVRRASERFKLALQVALDGKVAMTRDISYNGMAVRTDAPMPIGSRIAMKVTAPGAEAISLDVIVRRHIDEPGFRGIGVEFVDVSADTKDALVALVATRGPRDEVRLVAHGDPELH